MGHSYKADALVLKLQAQIKFTTTADKVAHNCKGDKKKNPGPERADKIVLYYKGR